MKSGTDLFWGCSRALDDIITKKHHAVGINHLKDMRLEENNHLRVVTDHFTNIIECFISRIKDKKHNILKEFFISFHSKMSMRCHFQCVRWNNNRNSAHSHNLIICKWWNCTNLHEFLNDLKLNFKQLNAKHPKKSCWKLSSKVPVHCSRTLGTFSWLQVDTPGKH